MCLAQGHNAVALVRLEPAASRTLPLSHCAPYEIKVKPSLKTVSNRLTYIEIHDVKFYCYMIDSTLNGAKYNVLGI